MADGKTAAPQKSLGSRIADIVQPFAIGGFSGICATTVVQPIDTVKVRIQLLGKAKAKDPSISTSPLDVARKIRTEDGLKGFYKGIDSAWLRQATYATARLGIYKSMTDSIKEKQKKKEVSFFEKFYCSVTAGAIGSIIGNPMDLILVRFQSDTMQPPEKRRNYKHAGDAFMRIIREEGVLALWRGVTPTMARAVLLNFGQLAPFDQAKEFLNKMTNTKDTVSTRLMASAFAGVCAAVLSLPADNLKTKLQEMRPSADGKMPYKGLFDCFTKSVKTEGFFGLWVGLPTFLFRVSPHAMITLLVQDFATDSVKAWRSGNKH